MKKLVLSLLALFVLTSVSIAQDGKKSLKEATKSIGKYTSNPLTEEAALDEGLVLLEEAFKDAEISGDPKSWLSKGDLYKDVADAQVKNTLINPDFVSKIPNAAILALEAYAKSLDFGDKKVNKNTLKNLGLLEEVISNTGINMYTAENYKGAYENFNAEILACDLLRKNGEASRLDSEGLYAEKLYFAGLTAFYAENYEDSATKLKQASQEGKEEGVLYQILYEALNKMGKEEEALGYLEEGRKKFPQETGLLFSEINYYLAKGKLLEMTGKLEVALETEPDNNSIILTLGQVFDQLQVRSFEAGNMDEGNQNFEKAYAYYKRALENDADNFDINYSVGALFYNRAAALTPALNEAANDFSAAGNKKYDAIKDEMAGFFDKALPYFLKADALKNDDRNTLIALKEIYVRKNMIEKSNDYKLRLENLDN